MISIIQSLYLHVHVHVDNIHVHTYVHVHMYMYKHIRNVSVVYNHIVTNVCREMFAVEYFCEFRELYTTRENKNREDIGVVANKRNVDS